MSCDKSDNTILSSVKKIKHVVRDTLVGWATASNAEMLILICHEGQSSVLTKQLLAITKVKRRLNLCGMFTPQSTGPGDNECKN